MKMTHEMLENSWNNETISLSVCILTYRLPAGRCHRNAFFHARKQSNLGATPSSRSAEEAGQRAPMPEYSFS